MKEKFLLMFRSEFMIRHALPAALILVVSYFAGRVAGAFVRHVVRRIPHADETIERLAGSTVAWMIYLFGAIAALNAFGINTTGLLAALGGPNGYCDEEDDEEQEQFIMSWKKDQDEKTKKR